VSLGRWERETKGVRGILKSNSLLFRIILLDSLTGCMRWQLMVETDMGGTGLSPRRGGYRRFSRRAGATPRNMTSGLGKSRRPNR
jgi:hypothetical protein